MSPTGPNQAQNEVFRHFFEVESLAFYEIAWNYSLQQCLTSSKGETHEEIFRAQIWAKRVKIGLEISFFAIFSSLVH